MAFDEIARKRISGAVDAYVQKRRPPMHIRPKLDIGFRIDGQSVEIFEVRPAWDRPQEILTRPVARATYVRTRDLWKVFWMRADLKWHSYAPVPTVGSIEKFLDVVEADPHACFWGPGPRHSGRGLAVR
jgi:hypothetical protein